MGCVKCMYMFAQQSPKPSVISELAAAAALGCVSVYVCVRTRVVFIPVMLLLHAPESLALRLSRWFQPFLSFLLSLE